MRERAGVADSRSRPAVHVCWREGLREQAGDVGPWNMPKWPECGQKKKGRCKLILEIGRKVGRGKMFKMKLLCNTLKLVSF